MEKQEVEMVKANNVWKIKEEHASLRRQPTCTKAVQEVMKLRGWY